MSKFTKRVLVGLGGTGVALLATAGPAFANGTFVSPSGNFTWGVDNMGNPVTHDIQVTNFINQSPVDIEVCNGRPPTAPNYSANIDCDLTTAPAPLVSNGPTTVQDFNPNTGRAIAPFRGMGGFDQFNCLAPEDVKAGTPNADGSVTPIGDMTKNGNPIDTFVPSWTNCQVRVSSNNSSNTSDQSYITASLQNTPTVVKQTPTVSAVTGTPTTSTVGTSVTLSTTVTGTAGHPTPTGTVTFNVGGNAIGGSCTGAALNAGVATCMTFALPGGMDSLTAAYSGDNVYDTGTSAASTYSVSKLTPTVGLSSAPASQAGISSQVKFTATVTGAVGGPAPTGTVAFAAGGTAIPTCGSVSLVSGAAACTTSFPSAGPQNITAAYSGDTNYVPGTPGTETLTVVALPAAIVTASATPTSPIYGQAVTVKATVTAPPGTPGTPTGTVAFTSGAANTPVTGCSDVPIVGGAASCALLTPVAVGATPVTATYSGDATYGGSTGITTVTVARATPAMTVKITSPTTGTAKQGQLVTLNAHVTGPAGTTPGGTVSFTVGTTTLCTKVVLHGGTAVCKTTKLPAGTDRITAAYSGDSNFKAKTAATAGTIKVIPRFPTTLTVAPPAPASPQVAGTAVTITATVVKTTKHDTTNPTGTVGFTANGTAIAGCTAKPLGTVGTTTKAACTTTSLPVGTAKLVATYNPTVASHYLGSSNSTRPVSYTITAAAAPNAAPPSTGPGASTGTPAASPSSDPAIAAALALALPSAVSAGSGGQAAQHGVPLMLVGALSLTGLSLLAMAWRRRHG